MQVEIKFKKQAFDSEPLKVKGCSFKIDGPFVNIMLDKGRGGFLIPCSEISTLYNNNNNDDDKDKIS